MNASIPEVGLSGSIPKSHLRKSFIDLKPINVVTDGLFKFWEMVTCTANPPFWTQKIGIPGNIIDQLDIYRRSLACDLDNNDLIYVHAP